MRPEDAAVIRHVCQDHLDIHPVHYPEGAEVLRVFFGMDEEEIEALNILVNWVANHGLERR